MSRAIAVRLSGRGCVPRVSGDEPAFKELGGDIKECSPRERG